MRCENGETQEASRGLDSSYVFDKRKGLGEFQGSVRDNGIDQVGRNQVDCPRENFFGTTIEHGETPIGKILERLEFIENAYITYVKSHQERLEARLDESKEQEHEFREAVKQVKDEIYNLVSDQQQETEVQNNE